jgi:erythromycin esterase
MSALPEAALDEVADAIAAGGEVVGLGESTRSAHETFDVRDRLLRRLVRRHGFRALAFQDDASVVARLDAHVTSGAGTAESALESAWRLWRTAEMASALAWIRAFNVEHPDDSIEVFGVKPVQAGPADYDAVLAYARGLSVGAVFEGRAQVPSFVAAVRAAGRRRARCAGRPGR